jgi:hypothetical protein
MSFPLGVLEYEHVLPTQWADIVFTIKCSLFNLSPHYPACVSLPIIQCGRKVNGISPALSHQYLKGLFISRVSHCQRHLNIHYIPKQILIITMFVKSLCVECVNLREL